MKVSIVINYRTEFLEQPWQQLAFHQWSEVFGPRAMCNPACDCENSSKPMIAGFLVHLGFWRFVGGQSVVVVLNNALA